MADERLSAERLAVETGTTPERIWAAWRVADYRLGALRIRMPPVTSQPPDFDPFEVLGVDASADAATIDRAYKARIRFVHPDIVGTIGLHETKRLNVAREWLLDPALRAQLPTRRSWRHRHDEAPRGKPPPPQPQQTRTWEPTASPRPAWAYDPLEDDPLTFDYGSLTGRVRAFFGSVRSLSPDERARVTYSLGDEPPVYFRDFRELVGEVAWARSQALSDAIWRVWSERHDEGPPLLFPRGRVFGHGSVVADLYAQWLLLGDVISAKSGDAGAAVLASRCTWPWEASVGRVRYGPFQREVAAFLDDASILSLAAAERLARSWQRHMGGYLYGRPGEDWFPGAQDHPKAELVSARLAAVDASRIEPPDGLQYEHHNAFRCGLRLTAHMLALGGVDRAGRDFLRPWREAQDPSPSFWDRAHWGMPTG